MSGRDALLTLIEEEAAAIDDPREAARFKLSLQNAFWRGIGAAGDHRRAERGSVLIEEIPH